MFVGTLAIVKCSRRCSGFIRMGKVRVPYVTRAVLHSHSRKQFPRHHKAAGFYLANLKMVAYSGSPGPAVSAGSTSISNEQDLTRTTNAKLFYPVSAALRRSSKFDLCNAPCAQGRPLLRMLMPYADLQTSLQKRRSMSTLLRVDSFAGLHTRTTR